MLFSGCALGGGVGHFGLPLACNLAGVPLTRQLRVPTPGPRLAQQGWKLLNVISTFGPDGLNERQSSAGEYFLRF